ncbi:protein yellow-like [Trichogramma pretiosum]|uniref:protein yellow-like n=1 Tax=Trichogramma pretiosum TaxID=7493 RepID=UPI0006C9B8B2|nr:protein yellow-like [Trichogramma pretiosum]
MFQKYRRKTHGRSRKHRIRTPTTTSRSSSSDRVRRKLESELDSAHVANLWHSDPDPIYRYHQDFVDKYYGAQPWNYPPKPWMANNIVPWLVTLSLLGFQDLADTTSRPNSQISQELEAPPLPSITSSPVTDFVMPTTASFDDPAFGQEEPPAHSDCDFPSNHNYDNVEGSKITKRPHGFQIDPNFSSTQSNHLDTKKKERNLDNQKGVNSNSIVQTPKNSNRLNQSERFYNPSHSFKPPKDSGFKDEYAGPAMELAYYWKTVDYEFDNDEDRRSLLYAGTFIPENNLPLGLEISKDRIFVSLPRWKKGIPATLATISTNSDDRSPKLKPYPDWRWHHLGNCQGLTSVFRMQIDDCDRLWVLDSGKIDITTEPKQICPPTIFVFDLYTDELIKAYTLPPDQIKEDSLYSNIIVDVKNDECERAVAYAADVWRFGLVVYDFFNDSSYRLQHHYFFPDPLSSKFNLHGLEFQWTDGLFGLALTPVDVNYEKTMFFHPMSSFREFAVPLSALRDQRTAENSSDKFVPVGKPRAKDYGHSSGSTIDRNGVMFFNMVTRDSVWCWDTRKEYIPQNLGVVGASNISLVFPNDIRMDHEEDQNLWVLSNRLPMYLYGYLNKNEVNFRILKASAKEAVKNTVCDPNYIVPDSLPSLDVTC